MKAFQTTATAVVLSLCATSAMSAVVTVTNVYGEWTDSSPESVYGLSVNTTADESVISWGDPADQFQSAYSFEGLIPPPVEVDTETGAEFELGLFTHHNFSLWANVPWGAPSITSADLTVDFDVSIDGNDYSMTQVFTFAHDETPNNASPCAYGDAPGTGINGDFGCADRVTATLNEGLSESIIVDGMEYSFDISGFLYGDEDPELLSFFLTRENQENDAILVGRLLVNEVPEVPLPASGILLLGGLAGMAFARRRRD